MMKMKIALLTCVLLVSSLALVASENTFGPHQCCFSFYKGRMRKNGVVEFKYTDPQCAKPGVLFTMVNGNKICVDPNDAWNKSIMEAKEKELVGK